MPYNNHAMRINAIFARVFGIEHVAHLHVGVFSGMLEGKIALYSPRSAVMHRKHVPAMCAQILCDVQILLVAGEAVEEHSGRMRPRACRKIKNAI